MRFALLLIALTYNSTLCAEAITLCYEEWSPYASRSGEQNKGIVLTLLSQKSTALNVPISFVDLPHNRCVNGVKNDRYHGAIFIDQSDGLDLVSKPVAMWKIGFAVAEGHTAQNAADVNYGILILAKDYEYPAQVLSKLERLPLVRKRVQYYSQGDANTRGLFNYIIKGQADVMLVDEVWAEQMKSKLRLKIRMLAPAIHIEPQYIGVKPGDTSEAQKLKMQLTQILTDN